MSSRSAMVFRMEAGLRSTFASLASDRDPTGPAVSTNCSITRRRMSRSRSLRDGRSSFASTGLTGAWRGFSNGCPGRCAEWSVPQPDFAGHFPQWDPPVNTDGSVGGTQPRVERQGWSSSVLHTGARVSLARGCSTAVASTTTRPTPSLWAWLSAHPPLRSGHTGRMDGPHEREARADGHALGGWRSTSRLEATAGSAFGSQMPEKQAIWGSFEPHSRLVRLPWRLLVGRGPHWNGSPATEYTCTDRVSALPDRHRPPTPPRRSSCVSCRPSPPAWSGPSLRWGLSSSSSSSSFLPSPSRPTRRRPSSPGRSLRCPCPATFRSAWPTIPFRRRSGAGRALTFGAFRLPSGKRAATLASRPFGCGRREWVPTGPRSKRCGRPSCRPARAASRSSRPATSLAWRRRTTFWPAPPTASLRPRNPHSSTMVLGQQSPSSTVPCSASR